MLIAHLERLEPGEPAVGRPCETGRVCARTVRILAMQGYPLVVIHLESSCRLRILSETVLPEIHFSRSLAISLESATSLAMVALQLGILEQVRDRISLVEVLGRGIAHHAFCTRVLKQILFVLLMIQLHSAELIGAQIDVNVLILLVNQADSIERLC